MDPIESIITIESNHQGKNCIAELDQTSSTYQMMLLGLNSLKIYKPSQNLHEDLVD